MGIVVQLAHTQKPRRRCERPEARHKESALYELSLDRFKRCTKCGCTKLRNKESFKVKSRNKDGLAAVCKTCSRIQGLAFYHANKPASAHCYGGGGQSNIKAWVEFETGLWCRKCEGCSGILPMLPDYFGKNSNSSSGMKTRCRSCRARETKDYWAMRPEQRRECNRAYNEQNRERFKREYWENREKHLTYSRAYEAANKDVRRAHYEANRDKWVAYSRNRRARLRGCEGIHTAEEVWQMLEQQGHVCCWCEAPLFGKFHVDHFQALSQGGSNGTENIVVACPECNRRKHAKTPLQFLKVLGYDVVEETA